MMSGNKSKLYGLIGEKLTHSFSQNYFNMKFLSENIDAEYVNFEIDDISKIKNVISENPNLCGLNVTIPYKEEIIKYLDEIDDAAAAIGAVNVVYFNKDSKGNIRLKGYNSDVIGFLDSIRPLLNPLRDKALILGTGGASKAVAHAFDIIGIKYQFVSRSSKPGVITYNDLNEDIMYSHKIIVNTTPLGMYPHIEKYPDIPYNFLTPDHLCYDLLYNPDETQFMKFAKDSGAEVKNGLEMLLLQAFVSWHIWNDLI